MYLQDFGLRERPFSHAPDPRFVYLGEHRERALAHLLRSVQVQGGVAHLIGESGVGKTTICRMLLNRLPPRVDVALILNPVPTPQELLSVVCDELGVAYGTDAPSLLLGDTLYRKQVAGLGERRTVVIVDEAQSLSLDVLEQLYLLSFTENETCAYVRHRMTTAGGGRDIFDVDALRHVHHLSSGVPRQINTICARALLSAVAQKRRNVDRATVRAAARSAQAIEVPDEAPRIEPARIPWAPAPAPVPARAPTARRRRPLWPWLVTGGLVLNAVAIGAVLLAPRAPDVAPLADTRAEAEAPAAVSPPTESPAPPK